MGWQWTKIHALSSKEMAAALLGGWRWAYMKPKTKADSSPAKGKVPVKK